MTRITDTEYLLQITQAVALKGTCDRGRNGAIIFDGTQVLAPGYVGAPRGSAHCDDVGHLIRTVKYEDGSEHEHCVRTAHAEVNAIAQAARKGVRIEGASIFTLMEPCPVCAGYIVNAGIVKVISYRRYHGASLSREIFAKAGVDHRTLLDAFATYHQGAPQKGIPLETKIMFGLDGSPILKTRKKNS